MKKFLNIIVVLSVVMISVFTLNGCFLLDEDSDTDDIGINGSSSSHSSRLEIIGTPTMTVEYNEFMGYTANIRGKAQNNGRETTYVSVTFNLLNANHEVIGSVMDNHNTLTQGSIWNFNASVGYMGEEKPIYFVLADITAY